MRIKLLPQTAPAAVSRSTPETKWRGLGGGYTAHTFFGQVQTKMYIVKDDEQQVLLQKLTPTRSLDGGWTQVYMDPDGRSEWILFRHHSERQGGGQPVLRKNPVPEQLSDWMALCFSSGNEDDILGLAWELSKDFERWTEVLDWIENNSARLPIPKTRLFLNNLEIFQVKNRRSMIGKNTQEIENDFGYFSNLAKRAGTLINAVQP